jgi:signal transduction histidine kinase
MLPDFRIRQRDYLLEIARALTQELDLTKLLGRILTISLDLLAGQAGFIALRTPNHGWQIAVADGISSTFLKYLEPMLTRVPDSVRPDNSERREIDRLLADLRAVASQSFLNGVGLPLVTRKKVIGVIFVFRNYPDLFSGNDQILLSTFANQAAVAVQNAQLYNQVMEEKIRMNALLDSSADGMLILSSHFKIERCNPSFARLFGKPVDQIILRPHEDIIRWAKPPIGVTLEKASENSWPLTPNAQLYVEGDLERPGLTPLPVGITYAPLISPEGTLLNIIATIRDITRFRQADEMKSAFISVVSHELKTPVALIKGYVSTLRREDADWDKEIVSDSLQVIEEEADRLTGLIEDLLDASRLQSGGFSLKRQDVALQNIAEKIALRFRAQDQNHTFEVDFPPDFPVIFADENRIHQVISNLVTNAVKYSPSGEIRIRGQVRSDQVIVCVSDQGPGIAPNDIPYIFDRFYRSPDTSRKTGGAGLGLYLARSIVESHGGRMWVDPKPDEGARICFSLPR